MMGMKASLKSFPCSKENSWSWDYHYHQNHNRNHNHNRRRRRWVNLSQIPSMAMKKDDRFVSLNPTRLRSLPTTRLRHICQSSGQGSFGKAFPEEQDPKDSSGASNNSSEDVKKETSAKSSLEIDWRSFRARLVATEKPPNTGSESSETTEGGPVGDVWAHPIPVPESGCLLVATEKLDGQFNFERTVVLLLHFDAKDPHEGPFGIILNRPFSQTINDLKPSNQMLSGLFGDCAIHFGGPLEADMFLLLRGGQGGGGRNVTSFHQVIPGVYYGTTAVLPKAANLIQEGTVLPGDFRFYYGYSGWGLDQLMSEIAAGLWCVAACSADVITSSCGADLWEHVLQQMGGHYAEMSRKPKKNGFK